MKSKIFLSAVVVGAMTLLAGCSGMPSDGTNAESGTTVFEKKSDPLKFGYSIYDLSDPYFQSYLAGVEDAADELGIEIISIDSKGSQEEQVNGSQNLINQDISALLISPVEPQALPATITAAHRANIPVVVGDVGVVGNDYDAYVTSDNVGGGQIAVDYIVEQLESEPGKHSVAIIGLPAGNVTGALRVEAFNASIEANEDFEVVSELSALSIEESYKAAQDALTANPDLEAIYCASSNNAVGASRALAQAGKTDSVILVGFNGDPIELDMIEEGLQTATVAQQPYEQGRMIVEVALALLNGETIEFTDNATKTIEVSVLLVDKANIEEHRAKMTR